MACPDCGDTHNVCDCHDYHQCPDCKELFLPCDTQMIWEGRYFEFYCNECAKKNNHIYECGNHPHRWAQYQIQMEEERGIVW